MFQRPEGFLETPKKVQTKNPLNAGAVNTTPTPDFTDPNISGAINIRPDKGPRLSPEMERQNKQARLEQRISNLELVIKLKPKAGDPSEKYLKELRLALKGQNVGRPVDAEKELADLVAKFTGKRNGHDSERVAAFKTLENIANIQDAQLIAQPNTNRETESVIDDLLGPDKNNRVRARAILGAAKQMMSPVEFAKLKSDGKRTGEQSVATRFLRQTIVAANISEQIGKIPESQRMSRAAELIKAKLAAGTITADEIPALINKLFPLAKAGEVEKTQKSIVENRPAIKVEASKPKVSAEITRPKETLEKRVEREGVPRVVATEAKVLLEAVKRSQNDPKLSKERAFEAALTELIIMGTFDKDSIATVLERYSNVIGDRNAPENKHFYEAFMQTIDQMKDQFQELTSISDRAATEYAQLPETGKKKLKEYLTKSNKLSYEASINPGYLEDAAKELFIERQIAKELAIRATAGKLSPEQQKSLDDLIEKGSIRFVFPAFEVETRRGTTSSPTLPVLVADEEAMCLLTGIKDKKMLPRGVSYDTWSEKPNKESQKRNMQVVVINATGCGISDNPEAALHTRTFRHELVHTVMTMARKNVIRRYVDTLADSGFRSLLKSFEESQNIRLNPNSATDKQQIDALRQLYLDTIQNDQIPPDEKGFDAFVRVNKLVGQTEESIRKAFPNSASPLGVIQNQFAEFILTGPNRVKVRNAIVGIRKVTDELSSPMEELITLGMDMNDVIGLGDLGIKEKKYNANDPKHRAALGLMRTYNALYNESPNDDRNFYQTHEEFFTTAVMRKFGFRTAYTPGKVAEIVEDLWHKTAEQGTDGQQAKEIFARLALNIPTAIDNLEKENAAILKSDPNKKPIISEQTLTFLRQLKSGNLDALAVNDIQALQSPEWQQIIANDQYLPDWAKRDMLQISKKGNVTSLTYYLAYVLPSAKPEEFAGSLGVEDSRDLTGFVAKKSGPESKYRHFYDFDERFGGWGGKNYGITWLEAIPWVGAVSQNLIDSINPWSKMYRLNQKDMGPFSKIPVLKTLLNFKYIRDGFGLAGGDPRHRLDSSEPLEAITAIFGVPVHRWNWLVKYRDKRAKEIEKDLKKKYPEEKYGKKWEKHMPWWAEKKAYLPKAIVEPRVETYYSTSLEPLKFAMEKLFIPQNDQLAILSVLGGYSLVDRGPSLNDFKEVDEYRANQSMVEFIEREGDDSLGPLLGDKKDSIVRYHKDDAFVVYKNVKNNEVEPEIGIDITRPENRGRVKKGTMTRNLLNDICNSIEFHEINLPANRLKDKANDINDKRKGFRRLGQIMMTIDQTREGGFTMADLIEKLLESDDNDLMYPSNKDDYREKRKEVQEWLDSPHIVLDVNGEEVKIKTKDAKEFIAYYYLARMRRITEVGVWGMVKDAKKDEEITPEVEQALLAQGMTPQQIELLKRRQAAAATSLSARPVASKPEAADGRKYSLKGRRKLIGRDDASDVMMMSADLINNVNPLSPQRHERLNGKLVSKIGNLDLGFECIEFKHENGTHDLVTGGIWAAERGQEIAFQFTTKIRQVEAYRDMAKAKKEMWEGVNNLDDNTRTLVFIYCIVAILYPGLGLPLLGGAIPLSLLGWSLLVSPMINRAYAGWGSREMNANEVLAAMRDQYAESFYSLASEKKYHTPLEIRHAKSRYEAVKATYRKVLEDLGKNADPNSNFVAAKANGLLSKFFS